jgi:hypothetical protein
MSAPELAARQQELGEYISFKRKLPDNFVFVGAHQLLDPAVRHQELADTLAQRPVGPRDCDRGHEQTAPGG